MLQSNFTLCLHHSLFQRSLDQMECSDAGWAKQAGYPVCPINGMLQISQLLTFWIHNQGMELFAARDQGLTVTVSIPPRTQNVLIWI